MQATPAKIIVPGNHLMAGLLGERDELLRIIEDAFPDTDHPRAGQRDQRRRCRGRPRSPISSTNWCCWSQHGQRLDAARLDRTIDMVRADESPTEVLTTEMLRTAQRPHDPAEVRRPEALRRGHRRQHHHLRHRPGRHRQELAGGGHGRAGAAGRSRSTASSSPARRSRPASGSASCPAT